MIVLYVARTVVVRCPMPPEWLIVGPRMTLFVIVQRLPSVESRKAKEVTVFLYNMKPVT